MAGEYNRFVKSTRPQLAELSRPPYQAEAREQDMHPANMQSLQQAIRDPRHQRPMQQQVLGDELKRIQGMQAQQVQQAAQALPQEMNKELSPAKTGEPWPSPEAMMIRLMLKMQRRYPGMQSGPAPQSPF